MTIKTYGKQNIIKRVYKKMTTFKKGYVLLHNYINLSGLNNSSEEM